MRLENKVAVITGASSGLGRKVAQCYAREGANVVVSDVREDPLPGGFEDDAELTTVDAISKGGGTASFVLADVTKQPDVAALVAAAVDTHGRIDIMYNNAGVYRVGKLTHEFSEEDLDVCFNVNAKGSFFGAQEAVKQFLRQGDGGVIINLVSTAALRGGPRQSVYNMSKGAQALLTKCLAVEYGREGIRVNGICPTYAKTALTRDLFDDLELMKNFEKIIPLQRWGEAEDVANLAVFLASRPTSRATSTARSSPSMVARSSRASRCDRTRAGAHDPRTEEITMKFAIIGAGDVGSAIARAVTDAGHDAVVSAPPTTSSRSSPTAFPPPRRPRMRRPSPVPTRSCSPSRSELSTRS